MPHERNLLEQTLARTVRMDDRMRFGAQQQGIVSTPRSVLALVLYLQCVTSATERMPRQALHSYAGPAEPSSPQIRRAPQNKAPKPHPEARKTQASGEIAEEETQPKRAAEAQAEGVSSTEEIGGRHRTRTYDPLRVKQVLSPTELAAQEGKRWRAWRDSNPRPLPPQGSALSC